jgi:hypothetical protein
VRGVEAFVNAWGASVAAISSMGCRRAYADLIFSELMDAVRVLTANADTKF